MRLRVHGARLLEIPEDGDFERLMARLRPGEPLPATHEALAAKVFSGESQRKTCHCHCHQKDTLDSACVCWDGHR